MQYESPDFATLMANLPSRFALPDRSLIERAYQFAEKAHYGVKRTSGEPYISHSLAVAQILLDLKLPAAALAAGLLHDVVEDSNYTVEDLRRLFGDEVARLVDAVTKITKQVERTEHGQTAALQAAQPNPRAETLRKTILAMGDDIRVMLIKLADRLHNMRTLGALSTSKQHRIAQETLDIMAPIANRLGIWQIKWELEDLSLRYLHPDAYKDIASKINARRLEREQVIRDIKQRLEAELKALGIPVVISGRPKHIYSIWKKMNRKNVPFEEVFDVRAVRIMVKHRDSQHSDDKRELERRERLAKADCYVALGIVHELWHPIPKEFDDYIANPKDNFYQSIHTAVRYSDGQTLEIQIRTEEMHNHAEFGIAAHWRYKEGDSKLDESFEKRINWLRNMMRWDEEATRGGDDFLEAVKLDMFPARVFVFTPRGDTIDLPQGATPIDFAYHIHTQLGERCRGAKVNGKIVDLSYKLKSSDMVQIIAGNQGGPNRDWLNEDMGYVASARARQKIKAWFKKQDYQLNVTIGRNVLKRGISRLNLGEPAYDEVAAWFGYQKRIDDFLAALGSGDIHEQTVINRLVQHLRSQSAEKAQELPPDIPQTLARSSSSESIIIQGYSGMQKKLANCCNPVVGEEIVGYTTIGRGVTVHRKDCHHVLRHLPKERLIIASWGRADIETFPVPIVVNAYDRTGLMRDLGNVAAAESISISAIEMKETAGQSKIQINATIQVHSLPQLTKLLNRINQLDNVIEARRR